MKRAKQLGNVIFGLNTLFIQEEESDDSVISEMVVSAGGTHIVYESEIITPYITLDSKTFGWITEEQRVILKAMKKQLGINFTLTYDDDTTETVRIAREKKLVFTPTYEGSEKYTAIIPLAKVL